MSLPFDVPIPFVEQVLGITLEESADGHAVIHYRPRPEHCNSYSVAHGGVVMTLLDVAMAAAAFSAQPDSGIVTIEMKASFMRPTPLQDGQPVVGKGLVAHRTRSTAFVEGRVFDAAGNLCAMSTGTIRYVPKTAQKPAATD